ncbi:hypothetical protein MAUB1S_09711 [Mycolicibacterium aubagnense]
MTPAEAIDAVEPIARAILPKSASAIERAVLSAELARIVMVDPTVIVTIWNPVTCPTVLLPWLAQGVSVDVWANDWPEATKRAVIAASPMVHRLKGTLGAVRRALAAFDLETRVIEWWEDGSRRGTFRVEIVYRNGGPVFDLPTQGFAIQSVDAAKPKSRVFSTRAVLQARGPVYVGAFAQTALSATAHPFAFDPPLLRAANFVGATAALIMYATAHPKAA